jgi:hypothetical protein
MEVIMLASRWLNLAGVALLIGASVSLPEANLSALQLPGGGTILVRCLEEHQSDIPISSWGCVDVDCNTYCLRYKGTDANGDPIHPINVDDPESNIKCDCVQPPPPGKKKD